MMLKLDNTDVSIIQELNQDGRTTATEIAGKLGNISARVVQYRIKKLIRDVVIRVVAIIELEPLGFLTRADVLIDVEPGKIKSVARQLAKHDAISYVACHFGAHDISITVHARDNKDFLTFLNESITSISGVLNVQPILLPQLLKYPFLWFGFEVGRSMPPIPVSSYISRQSIKLEAVDIEIINLLVDDGRTSFTQIARRLKNCSTEFVQSRIEFLIQKKIIQIKAVVNPEKLGYLIRADVFVKSEAGQTMEVAQKLAQLSITSRVACGMGGDISVQLHGRSNDEIYDFITNTIPRIRGVKKTHTNIVAELVKEFHLCHLPKSIRPLA
jgi:DNA-binding Lrp family transcriptional regulator